MEIYPGCRTGNIYSKMSKAVLHTSQVCDNHPVTATASAGQSRVGLVDFVRHGGGVGGCVIVVWKVERMVWSEESRVDKRIDMIYDMGYSRQRVEGDRGGI